MGQLNLMDVFNALLSPEAKQKALELGKSKDADQYYKSQKFLDLTGGVPVGALDKIREFHQDQQVQEMVKQLKLQNTGGEGDLKLTGGTTLAGAKLPSEIAGTKATASYHQAAANAEEATAAKTKQDMGQSLQTISALGTTPEAYKAKTERTSAGAAGAEHIAMVHQMMSDPKQRPMFLNALKVNGLDTKPYEDMWAKEAADNKAKMDGIMNSDASKKPGYIAPEDRTTKGRLLFENLKRAIGGHSTMLDTADFKNKMLSDAVSAPQTQTPEEYQRAHPVWSAQDQNFFKSIEDTPTISKPQASTPGSLESLDPMEILKYLGSLNH